MTTTLANQLPRINLANGGSMQNAQVMTPIPVPQEQMRHADAIETLQSSSPYDLGSDGTTDAVTLSFHPVYVRGMAYLAAHRGSEAADEFQKIPDHPGVVWNSPIGVLAHLQLGRAYAMQGCSVKAKAAYQDFFTLWKDADPDIPILKQA